MSSPLSPKHQSISSPTKLKQAKIKQFAYDIVQRNSSEKLSYLDFSTDSKKSDLLSFSQNNQEFHDKLKKIDNIASLRLPLSKESYYDEYHMKLFQSFMSNRDKTYQEAVEPKVLEENIRVQLESLKDSYQHFKIMTEYNTFPIKILINSHTGTYISFLRLQGKATKENHDFLIDKSPFLFELPSLYMYDSIYLSILPISNVKLSVSYYFIRDFVDFNEKPIVETVPVTEEVSFKLKERIHGINDEEFYAGVRKRQFHQLDANKEIAKEYLNIKKEIFLRNKEENIIKRQKAIYNSDKLFFSERNETLIKYMKNQTKRQEKLKILNEQNAKIIYVIFQKEWIKLIAFMIFIKEGYNRYRMRKTLAFFLMIKKFKVSKIQRFFRKVMNLNRVESYHKRMLLGCSLTVNFHTKFLKKRIKRKAKYIIANFFRELKQPYNIFICTFKTHMKISFIMNKVKLLRRSQIQRIAHLKRLFDEEISIMFRTEQESITFYLSKINEIEKEKILNEYLKMKKCEYFKEIQNYLIKKARLGKKNAWAMKFLESVKEKETLPEDTQISEMTKNSVLYRSISPRSLTKVLSPREKIRMNQEKKIMIPKPVVYTEELMEKNVVEEDNISMTSKKSARKNSKSKTLAIIPKVIIHLKVSVDTNIIDQQSHSLKALELITPKADDEETLMLERPIFKYVPKKEEIRELIMRAVQDIKKKQVLQ